MKLRNRLLILATLLPAVAAGCLLSRNQNSLPIVSSPSETAPEEATFEPELKDAQDHDDEYCTIAFPEAALKPDLSKFRYEVKKEEYDLIETVSQENGVRLVVTQGGCVDSVVIGFEFSAPANGFPKSPEQQLVWMQSRLREFNCVGFRCDMVTDGVALISKHIDKIKRRPAGVITTSNLTVCHDETIEGEPSQCFDSDGKVLSCENVCSWDTGGSTRFEVKSDGKGRMILRFSEARSA